MTPDSDGWTKGKLTISRNNIRDESGELFSLVGVSTPMTAGMAQDEARANAAHIVHIWNTHPALVEALEADILAEDAEREFAIYRAEVAAGLGSEYFQPYCQETYETFEAKAEWAKRNFREKRDAALEALAAARGKEVGK